MHTIQHKKWNWVRLVDLLLFMFRAGNCAETPKVLLSTDACACAVQKPTCNSAIILSPSSSSSSFTADATASPVFRDNV